MAIDMKVGGNEGTSNDALMQGSSYMAKLNLSACVGSSWYQSIGEEPAKPHFPGAPAQLGLSDSNKTTSSTDIDADGIEIADGGDRNSAYEEMIESALAENPDMNREDILFSPNDLSLKDIGDFNDGEDPLVIFQRVNGELPEV